jgi:hypothetical protein
MCLPCLFQNKNKKIENTVHLITIIVISAINFRKVKSHYTNHKVNQQKSLEIMNMELIIFRLRSEGIQATETSRFWEEN